MHTALTAHAGSGTTPLAYTSHVEAHVSLSQGSVQALMRLNCHCLSQATPPKLEEKASPSPTSTTISALLRIL